MIETVNPFCEKRALSDAATTWYTYYITTLHLLYKQSIRVNKFTAVLWS